jgi:nucleotide-binding universal stress UspA family protein
MQKLVVGVDGSPGGLRALRWAAEEARLWAAHLHIVHCYPAEPDTGVWLDDDEQTAIGELEDITDGAEEDLAGLEWDAQVVWAPLGSCAYKLVELAREADLLAVGSRGLGGFLQLLLGSVSHHVSTHATTTVAVVRGRGDIRVDGRDVVVGVDGSAPSLRALRWGAREAERRGVAVRAVHAYAVPSTQRNAARGVGFEAAAKGHDLARAAASELLAAGVDRAQLPAYTPVRQIVAAGSPAGVLVSMTKPDELLVCGPRGLRPLEQKVLGSVSDQCLRHAQAPVVLAGQASPSPG